METCKKKDAITEIREENLEQVTGGMRDPYIGLESSPTGGQKKRRICKKCGSGISVNPDGYCSRCANEKNR